jgi:hypothetical protein
MVNRIIDDQIVITDSVTKIGPECEARVVLGASHGGIYAAYLAVKVKARGVILNDAGWAKDHSGVSGSGYCQGLNVPYATTDTMSCRIGNGESAVADGVISFANPLALSLGVTVGMSALEAAWCMTKADRSTQPAPSYAEARKELPVKPGERMIVLMDSISLVNDQDAGRIVVSGSHGAMLGNDPATAIRGDAFAGFFHDAGGGKDGAATTRLPALNQRGIIAGTVGCMSARIGDGESIYRDGVLSHLNEVAVAAGGKVGMPAKTFIDSLVTK